METAMPIAQRIAPLWFDSQAQEAANSYVSIFKNARIFPEIAELERAVNVRT
jgi:predicted 3-demethylubiquinone-9 3-methyltransferase (glyoxalase superfamily)